MKKNIVILLIAISISVLLNGCNANNNSAFDANNTQKSNTENNANNGNTANDNAGNANNATTETNNNNNAGGNANSAQVAEKINYYVDCINRHSERVLQSYDRYLSWADAKTGPTGKEQIVYGLYPIYETKQCLDGLNKAKGQQPSYPELDKSGEAYVAALTKVEPLIAEANEYYEQGNYKDDAMAKGKEMHPKLMEAWQAFESADRTMRTELDKIQDELDVQELAELEKTEGRKVDFLTRNAMFLAKKVLREGNKVEDKINLESFTKNIEEYEKAYKELKDYVAAHKSEIGTIDSIGVDSFIRNANDFLTASKELMRRIRDKVPYSTGEQMNLGGQSEWMVDGSPGQVLYRYNSLVDASNSMNRF